MTRSDRLPLLHRPLVQLPAADARLPEAGGSTPRGRVLALDSTARWALAAGDAAQANAVLHELRYESYREASLAWEDHWWLARVAGLEELEAERSRQQADWPEAWASWRSGWWVRQLLAKEGGRAQRRRAVWSTAVMGALHLAVGRSEDGVRRIREALEPWSELGMDAHLQAELRAAVGPA